MTSRLQRRCLATAAIAALATAAAVSTAQAGPALPTGGKVVVGQAAIGSPSGGSLTITQSSGKAIIDWSGFSTDQVGKVAFDNGLGATPNRVTGGAVSNLDGLLSAASQTLSN